MKKFLRIYNAYQSYWLLIILLAAYLCFLDDGKSNTLDGIVLGALISCYFPFWSSKIENRKNEVSKVNAALAALENDKGTLLNFKGRILQPYSYSISKMSLCKKNKINIDFILENPLLHNMFSTQMFNNFNYADKLAFLVVYDQELLCLCHQIYQGLFYLNEFIADRNKRIFEFFEAQSHQQKVIDPKNKTAYMDAHTHYCKHLHEIVDDILQLQKICVDRLRQCLKNNYWLNNKEIHSYHFNTGYENLMPNCDPIKDSAP